MIRDVINGKAGKAAALPKFSDMLTLSQSGEGADYAQPLVLLHLKDFMTTPLDIEKKLRKIVIISAFQITAVGWKAEIDKEMSQALV